MDERSLIQVHAGVLYPFQEATVQQERKKGKIKSPMTKEALGINGNTEEGAQLHWRMKQKLRIKTRQGNLWKA